MKSFQQCLGIEVSRWTIYLFENVSPSRCSEYGLLWRCICLSSLNSVFKQFVFADYDGYDDVYGHSVDDDYYISPSNRQFLFNRENSRDQPRMGEFICTEQDIQEEDESDLVLYRYSWFHLIITKNSRLIYQTLTKQESNLALIKSNLQSVQLQFLKMNWQVL